MQLYKMAANVGSCKTCLENNNKESLESENNDEKLHKLQVSNCRFNFYNIRVESFELQENSHTLVSRTEILTLVVFPNHFV